MAGKKRTGLGRGVEALIKPTEKNEAILKPAEGEIITKVDISKVEPDPEQPRKTFSEDEINELAASIKEQGIIEPLIVTDEGDHYEIVGGERRWRAAMQVGLTEVPVVVRKYTKLQKMQVAFIDNEQREDLNDIEKAMQYNRFLTEFDMTQEQVAKMVSKSRSAVANVVRLLNLEEEVQQMIIDEKISSGHARALIPVDDAKQQYELAERVFDEKLSVRDIEKLVKDLGKEKKEKKKKEEDQALLAIYAKLEEKLKTQLGTKVSIIPKDNGTGKLEIEFYSGDELDRIMEHIH